MSVWYSQQTTSVETSEGVSPAVRIVIAEGLVDSSGNFSIDLSPFGINSILDYSLKVLDAATTITELVLTQVNTLATTLITGVAGIASTVLVELGSSISPLKKAPQGTRVRVTLFCK